MLRIYAQRLTVYILYLQEKFIPLRKKTTYMLSKIIVLDGYTLNPGDLSWQALKSLGNIEIFDRTPQTEVLLRAKDAEILIVNKVIIDVKTIAQLPHLKCIFVTATGYNNVDILAAAKRNIPVCNVRGYSTNSVAQHVFSLILQLTNQVDAYHASVQKGDWSRSPDFCYYLGEIPELAGKIMGIYGFGQIGQAVAKIALAFGMKVIAKHKHPDRDSMPGVTFVDEDTLFYESDIISLHAPLTPENRGLINRSLLKTMQPSSLIINTARGGFIVEEDLKWALENHIIAGAALDVLSTEPPIENHVLLGLPNCIITPHIAWASKAARERLMQETVDNVQAFLEGKAVNVVNHELFI